MNKLIIAGLGLALGAYLGVLLALSQGYKLVDELLPSPAARADYSYNQSDIESGDGQLGRPFYQPQQPGNVVLEAPFTSLQPAANPVNVGGTVL
jgi:hypothetical protein